MHPWAKRLLPQPRKILTDENFRPELTRALAQPNNPDLRLDWKLFSQLVPTGPDLKEKARATCAIQDLWEKGAPLQQESFEHDFEGPA